MVNVAKRSLQDNPSLSKVVIMEHPPRFDSVNMDPISLKPNLVRLANATLGQCWLNSAFKDKIIIGRHSLESSGVGATHVARYQNSKTGRCDGVHLYGPTGWVDYTNSVKTIMLIASPTSNSAKDNSGFGTSQPKNHNNCEQAKYQRKQYHPPVQTKNRFNVLNQGNF